MKILAIAAVLILLLTAAGCAAEIQTTRLDTSANSNQTTKTTLQNHKTVQRIAWGAVPYDRDKYASADWKSVRDRVCGAPKLFYTGRDNTACEADHVMSVSEAHHRGAHRMTDAEKRAFYTDADNLVASQPEVNRDKSNRSPEQVAGRSKHSWNAPGNDCEYVRIWTDIAVKYDLDITRAERSSAVRFLSGCQD